MMTFRLSIAPAALLALLAAGPALAAPTLYTSGAAFDAAAASIDLTEQGFETPFASANTLTFGAMTISCTNCAAGRSSSYPTAGSASLGINGGQPLSFTFDSPINAFGFSIRDFGTLSRTSLSLTVNGTTLPLLSNFLGGTGNTLFFGVTDSAPISSIVLSGGVSGDNYYLDRIQFGAQPVSGAVPEPASWAMMIGGLGIVGAAMRRRPTRVSFA